jgi:ABC-type oligopeptide transport system, periplasmic component
MDRWLQWSLYIPWYVVYRRRKQRCSVF